MKKELSSLEVFAVAKELQSLVDGRIDQIYQLDRKVFVFQIYKASGKQWLKILPQAAFLLKEKGQMPEKPEGFCLFLRKRLSNARITAAEQVGRVLVLKMAKDSNVSLIAEFYGKGNLLLVQDGKILGVAEQQMFEDRQLRPGQEYVVEGKNAWELSEKEFSDKLSGDNIPKALATIGLGGVYSREICSRAMIKPGEKITAENAKKAYDALQQFAKEPIEAQAAYDKELIDATPWMLEVYAEKITKPFATYSEALTEAYPEEIKSPHARKIEQLKASLAKQEESISRLQKEAELEQKKGELMYEKYQEVKAMLDELQKLRKEVGMRGLKASVKGLKRIKKVDEAKQMVVVEI